MEKFISPLKAWKGDFKLPVPDEFSGAHWAFWRKAAEKPLRTSYSDVHFYGYVGIEMIKQFGEWNMLVPIEEVAGWERSPDDEKTKLIAWVSREFRFYINGIIDPKE
jgi:hypothetical protein